MTAPAAPASRKGLCLTGGGAKTLVVGGLFTAIDSSISGCRAVSKTSRIDVARDDRFDFEAPPRQSKIENVDDGFLFDFNLNDNCLKFLI